MDLILYIIVTILFSILFLKSSPKYQNTILLIFCFGFYLHFSGWLICILIYEILISYIFGLIIEKNKNRTVLLISVFLSLLALLYYKYFPIISKSNIIVPLGISYYSFQSLSYIIDIFRGNKAEKNIINYSCYISFFPIIFCGPILRYKDYLYQLTKRKYFNAHDYANSLKLISWGLFKKSFADCLAIYVNEFYNSVYTQKGFVIIIAIVLYTLQIYCDFSGYSEIAKGTAVLIGFDIVNNFNKPYFSTTIKEFWSKWHMSLTTWLKDYIYIPLGGNRCSKIRHYLNIIVTFIVSGIWHGTNITFLIWGFFHGIAQIIEHIFSIKPTKDKFSATWAARCLLVFVVICLSWVIFRANSLYEVFYILNYKNILSGIESGFVKYIIKGIKNIGLTDIFTIIQLIICFCVLVTTEYISMKKNVLDIIDSQRPFIKNIVYVAFIILILFIIPIENKAEFIYFKF